ncbi:MAG TPA: sigma-54 dependent transcriptional regulator, partial [Candidatus Polarisedimenticolaceae bacterium]|nr:sigma-54 dependent transcriptional regulator [Candidatus Polarisedimenticolaceae bacterium]
FGSLVGRSPQMQAMYVLLEKIADTDLPVLIRGESGTGKELVARALHLHGRRRRRPFLGENCAAIPEALLESELFGHVRGAFTGADRDRPGLFEQASGGTLFLDEVGDMPAPMQARLLRVLEEGKVRRVGSERTLDVDVRVVAATHRDLQREIEGGRFREDLLYRLQVLTVEIPPLRARTGDIPVLTAHFLERIAAGRGRPDPWLVHEDALAVLERHPWPGNVRELQNTLQRLSLLAGNRAITEALIASDPTLRRTLLGESSATAAYSLRAGEREQVRQALAAAQGNRKRAAALLGVSRATLYRKLEQHDL